MRGRTYGSVSITAKKFGFEARVLGADLVIDAIRCLEADSEPCSFVRKHWVGSETLSGRSWAGQRKDSSGSRVKCINEYIDQ